MFIGPGLTFGSTQQSALQQENQKAKNEAYKRIAEDITMVDDDHLDLTLVQEEIFLNAYLPLLENQ